MSTKWGALCSHPLLFTILLFEPLCWLITGPHTILLGDAFKGRNDPAVGSTKRPFFSPVVRQPLCFEVLENCSNLTFKSQSLILFAFAKVASTTAMILIVFNSIFTGEDEYTIL